MRKIPEKVKAEKLHQKREKRRNNNRLDRICQRNYQIWPQMSVHRIHVHPKPACPAKNIYFQMLNQNNNRPLSFSFFAIIDHICTLFSNICYCCTPHPHTFSGCLCHFFSFVSVKKAYLVFRDEVFHRFFFLLNLPFFDKRKCAKWMRMTEFLSDF